jgi:hypothetical protein
MAVSLGRFCHGSTEVDAGLLEMASRLRWDERWVIARKLHDTGGTVAAYVEARDHNTEPVA